MTPGLSASAFLRLNTGSQGVVVHRDALIRYPDGRITLWAVNKQGDRTTVSEHQVQTGLSFNGKITIAGGLAPDTLVVVKGNEALRDERTVIVQPWHPVPHRLVVLLYFFMIRPRLRARSSPGQGPEVAGEIVRAHHRTGRDSSGWRSPTA